MSISFFKIIPENLADRFERTGKVCYTDIENVRNLERDETMLDWIQEQEDVWQRLQRCEKPIVMYGMGDGAVKILQVMKRYGIKIEAMFASDEFVRGHQFMGYQVEKLSDLQKRYDDFLIVMAFAVRDQPTVDRITALSKQYELVAPDVPVAGVNLFTMDFVQEHEEQLRQVEQLLADEQSRRVLHSIVNFKLSGKLEYLTECTTDPEEAYRCILKPTAEESFADLGAYRGDTIAELLHYAGGCQRVFAFEPDERTYRKLCAAVEEMGLADRAVCVQMAAYSHRELLEFDSRAGRQSALREDSLVTGVESAAKSRIRQVQGESLDHIAGGEPVTFINMDVEGAERQALDGCREVIERDKPKLLIAAYHRSEDLFAIPLQIARMNPEYRFYLRHYRYIPAWDTNLYCV